MLIDDYFDSTAAKDSGLGSASHSLPTEISEPRGARNRIIGGLQQMHAYEQFKRQQLRNDQ